MTIANTDQVPAVRKRSRAKIWLRTGILALFGTLFGVSLYRDIAAGQFLWFWGLAVFLICLPVGFELRKLVPMQVHLASRHITMSFDRLYFALILTLVIGKAVTGQMLHLPIWSDVLMCAILGVMVGRLSGICLRVHDLKVRHGFLAAGDSATGA
jgi:multisubunit Na+/H+ antiporter MnhC subunit